MEILVPVCIWNKMDKTLICELMKESTLKHFNLWNRNRRRQEIPSARRYDSVADEKMVSHSIDATTSCKSFASFLVIQSCVSETRCQKKSSLRLRAQQGSGIPIGTPPSCFMCVMNQTRGHLLSPLCMFPWNVRRLRTPLLRRRQKENDMPMLQRVHPPP